MSLATRPLPGVSDFVVEKLAGFLAQRKDEMAAEVERLVGALSREQIKKGIETNHLLALYDLKMCEAALVHSGQADNVPVALIELINWLTPNDYVPVITYHDLIEVNPPEDMRRFFSGDIGQTEKLFYDTHRKVEHYLESLIEVILAELEQGKTLPLPTFDQNHQVSPARGSATLSKMPKGHFEGGFRTYLNKLEFAIRAGFDGPSGAFSFRIPELELLMWGDKLPEVYQQEILRKMPYYSAYGKARIRIVMEQGNNGQSLKDCALPSKDQPFFEQLNKLAVQMDHFRMVHYRAAAEQIPKVILGEKPGTSGMAEAGQYLLQKQQAMKQVHLWLLHEYEA